jgi:transketolase
MIQDLVSRERQNLRAIATAARGLCMDTVLRSKSGHIGLPLGATDIATLLYFGVMKHDPSQPNWPDRDRFVLSAGHGSALLYVMLHLAGYDVSIDDLKAFRQLGSKTPGHPEFGVTPGVECTTGPLGQGLAMAVGMALAEAHLSEHFSVPTNLGTVAQQQAPLVDHRTFVLAGDGCLMEGVALEAISLAGHLKLNRLVVFYDDNSITIDGRTSITFSEDVGARFAACGWNLLQADGHDLDDLAKATDMALEHASRDRGATGPTVIVCKTVAGKGLERWQGLHKVHGNPHTAEDVRKAKGDLGLGNPDDTFFVSAEVRQACQSLLAKIKTSVTHWRDSLDTNLSALPQERATDYCRRFGSVLDREPSKRKGDGSTEPFFFSDHELGGARGEAATRVFSGRALQLAYQKLPEMMGGSADLAGSNNTTLEATSFVAPGRYAGSNIHFGVREHAMAAVANGLAVHGGVQPYCATFAVFSDYMRPAIRLAALMKVPTVFVLTHDSYAVGEDGPTHQPIEHAAALRAIPNLKVLRPADGLETFAAWQEILSARDQPSSPPNARPTALLLTRQNVPDCDDILTEQGYPPRLYEDVRRGIAAGGYSLRRSRVAQAQRHITILASGSEVADALRMATLLEGKNGRLVDRSGKSTVLAVDVCSVPDPTSLSKDPRQLEALVPENHGAVAIEAGVPLTFAALLGPKALVIGLETFGESAPASALKSHFGLTPLAMVQRVLKWLGLQEPEQGTRVD